MVDAVLLERVGERADDVLLPDHVCERAGAMTAVQRSGQGSVESSGATSGLGVRAAIAIPRQESHSPHGEIVGPFTQFSDAARIFAIDVFPVPREPTNR